MNFGQLFLIQLVRFYRCVLSPLKFYFSGARESCRFTPSCSAYALDAIKIHGAICGSVLSVRRLCRCHPWGGCGDDQVPTLQNAEAGKHSLFSRRSTNRQE